MAVVDEMPDRATVSPDLAVRIAQWAVALLTLAYFSFPAVRVISRESPPNAAGALAALALVAALQFRHMWHGLRAEPKVAWSHTLLWQALLSYLPAYLGGDAWLGVPSFLAASALVVLRPPRGYIVAVAVIVIEVPYAAMFYERADDIAYACLTTGVTALVVYGFIRLAALVMEVHRLRASLAQRAVDTERLRFARDLHDVLGHTLAAIVLKGELAGAMMRTRADDAERELAEIVGLARKGHREVREVVSGYRTASLSAELAGVTTVLTAAGIECVVDAEPLGVLPPEVAGPLTYALRESATNVLRHSRASRCDITLRRVGGAVDLTVVNDGVLSDVDGTSGSGLLGLRERADGGYGRLRAGPLPGGRFELAIHMPLRSDSPLLGAQ
jgi:two-component system, NarL family, sensor histidine kinase DesK